MWATAAKSGFWAVCSPPGGGALGLKTDSEGRTAALNERLAARLDAELADAADPRHTAGQEARSSVGIIEGANYHGRLPDPRPPRGDERPNVLLILADDMGFSDLGCHGGEIETPNLDRLARGGLRFTQAYNTSKCFPSRACLLTGAYAQQVGMDRSPGAIVNGVTLGEVLGAGGYRTLMTGKHHGTENPFERGFQRYFGLRDGGCNYFNPGRRRVGEPQPAQKRANRAWCIDAETQAPYTPQDPGFYTTDAFTDAALDYLEEYADEQRPFFLYVAYNAPHDPLQAWPEDIARYAGCYSEGWGLVRSRRHERQRELGLFGDDSPLSAPEFRDWSALAADERADQERHMQVYAAMVDRMDRNSGRLLARLEELDELDNTLVIFASDNGGSAEVVDIGEGEVGSMTRWSSLQRDWANVSNTPFRKYKNHSHEGGICTPLIAADERCARAAGRSSCAATLRGSCTTWRSTASRPTTSRARTRRSSRASHGSGTSGTGARAGHRPASRPPRDGWSSPRYLSTFGQLVEAAFVPPARASASARAVATTTRMPFPPLPHLSAPLPGKIARRLRPFLSTLCLAAPLWGQVQETGPVIPGLHERHPLGPVSVGRLLLDELQCGACHEGIAPGVVPSVAPDLSEVGRRFAPGELERFLADPAGARPGTKMPSLLHALPAGERAGVARAITHFLVSSSGTWSRGEVREEEIEAGDELFHTVGCVACHAPRRPPTQAAQTPAAREGAVGLGHVPAQYGVESLADFLFQPSRARPSGRMPDMGLSRGEARELASYLIGANPPASASLQVQAELVAEGRRHFEELACGACHPLEGPGARPPVEIVGKLDPRRGCLAEGDTTAPRFQLDGSQRATITSALRAADADLSDRERIDLTLTAFNCIACHVRDDYGGVRPEIDAYFETDEHELGDEARIPPQLTLAGAKLQGAWLRKVLFEGASVRPYMFTRMPRFGEANLAHLPQLLEREDAGRIEPFAMPLPEGDAARIARDAGRELMGIRGLSCIACHDFNGTPSPTHGGVDLINSPQRLQPSWFARFLIEPQTYRPGVVMPESWSGGVASHAGILDGDCDAQIRAVWYYLSQGRTARDPDGIHPVRSRLTVTDRTRTYRGRSSVAGFRGIAVGFPGGLSYAFNAQTGTLSALWRGDFVSVRWDGQGAGGFNPSGKVISLAQDVSFCRLQDADTPWPLRPRMDEENPVNPDPLYPRNHGYRFQGYSLDGDSIPTFRYASGDVSIEDRSEADTRAERPVLRRTLRFSAPTTEPLFFRVLTGEFETLSAREVRTPRLRLTLPDVPNVLRSPEQEGRPPELLLHLPAGSSSITIDYELLD